MGITQSKEKTVTFYSKGRIVKTYHTEKRVTAKEKREVADQCDANEIKVINEWNGRHTEHGSFCSGIRIRQYIRRNKNEKFVMIRCTDFTNR